MRDTYYIFGFLVLAALLVFFGRSELPAQNIVTGILSFAGTTAIAVLMVSLYRVRTQLAESRHELARKDAELNFAHEVQRALFPRQVPMKGGLEFSAVCIPAQGISGDYYDIIETADERIIFSIADISGKGISAAILMANLQALLRVTIYSADSLQGVLQALNKHFCQVTESNKFATFFVAEWNPSRGTLRYVNAGHVIPIVKGSSVELRLSEGGPPVGLFSDIEYEVGEVELKPSDLLVLYSDGVSEAQSEEGAEFGVRRLCELVENHGNKPIKEIQAEVLEAVGSWTGKEEPQDDMTILLVRARIAEEQGEI